MSLIKGIEIYPLASVKGKTAEFFTPQSSDETMLVQILPGTVDDLFVHHFQTDQLLVVRGSLVLVVLQNRRYKYIALSQHQPTVVKIPPGVPHGAINLTKEPCVLVNAVLRHEPAHERDYPSTEATFSLRPHNCQGVAPVSSVAAVNPNGSITTTSTLQLIRL